MEQRFFQKYKSSGLVIVGIDSASEDYPLVQSELANFVSTIGITFPAGVEETTYYSQFTANYAGTNPYPVDILVDKTGTIRYVAREYDPGAMDAMIQQLLAE